MSKKNSFLKFLVVPHNEGSNKWVKLPIIFFFLILVFLILIGIFFLGNLGKYVDVSSVNALRSDNERLEEKVEMLSREKEWLKASSDSILNVQDSVLKWHYIGKYAETKDKSYPLDSLLFWARWIDKVFKASLKMDDSLLEIIPSILPVKGHIVKYFGKQIDPFTEKIKQHNGINILTQMNSPVIATADGKIRWVGQRRGTGLVVEVAHWRHFITLYGHLLSATVEKGDIVKRGDIIGYVGQSGRAPYPYLYYQVEKDSVPIDPLNIILGGI